MAESSIQLVECPRDAMQGWKPMISTAAKVEYLNALLKVGFHTIDFGSFVSAQAIPQMADTRQVIPKLDIASSRSKLLAIVANLRGAEEAVQFDEISFIGYPFSISETFQLRNTGGSIASSVQTLEAIRNCCDKAGKLLVVYISMGFGNPYGDPYTQEMVFSWVDRIAAMGVQIISLADTVGIAEPSQVSRIMDYLVAAFPGTEIGVHLHSSPENREAKVNAALTAGCMRFDGALKGIGGCPMAGDQLVGNINTEWMIGHFRRMNLMLDINEEALNYSLHLAARLFKAEPGNISMNANQAE